MSVMTVDLSDERLPNGLRLIMAPDHLSAVVGVNVWYDVGSRHEALGKTGLAHLFEHLMFEGSAHVAKGEHQLLIESAGGEANASTWWDNTGYFETAPSHQLELMLWLEADRLATLPVALNQTNLDNQRSVVKNEKRSSYDNRPYGDWVPRLQAQLFEPGSPYHHPTIGSMVDLDAANLDDVVSFFRANYLPANAVLVIAGDFEPDQAHRWVERYFGDIPAGTPVLTPVPPPAGRLGGERRELIYDRVPLPRLYLGFHIPPLGDPRFEALEVAAQVLAGGLSSRLYRRLIREGQLAQDVEMSIVGLARPAWALVEITINTGVAPARVEAVLASELERLGREPVSPDELARAFALIETREFAALSKVTERAERLAMYATFLDDPGFINASIDRYASVSADDIMAACQYLSPDNQVTLTYLPEAG
jgi:zinc protease